MSNKKITAEQVELYVATEPDKAKALEFLRELKDKRWAAATALYERGIKAGDHFKWQQLDASKPFVKQSWYTDVINELIASIDQAFSDLHAEVTVLTAGCEKLEKELGTPCAGVTSVEGQLHLPCSNPPLDGSRFCAEHPGGFKEVSTLDFDEPPGTGSTNS